MPRDLFGNVTRPSISIGNRKWYTVPVSLLSHSLILALVVIVPIIAAPLMPAVLDNGALVGFITIVPPPPPLPPKRDLQQVKPIEHSDAAPFEAPAGISEEKPRPVLSDPTGPEIVLGDPSSFTREVAPPPPPVVEQPPVRVGTYGVRPPQKLNEVNPVYPQIAMQARIQGIVIIEATISPSGDVVNARILRSVPLLDPAAIEAVKQWRYTPSMLNGVPVPVIMTVTVNFTLK